MHRIWKWCSSLQLGLWLLAGIIAASLAGALLPERQQHLVYYSWWFFALLAVFCGNVLACVLSRMFRRRGHLASLLTHLSVLVIMAGGLASFLWSERGTVELTEGQETRTFNLGGRQKPLGFTLTLEKFAIHWYGSGPLRYDIRVIVRDPALKRKYLVSEQQEQPVENSGYAFSVMEYMPDFSLDEQNRPANRSSHPNNPAVRLLLRTPAGQEERWVFANHPEFSLGEDENVRIFFVWEPMIREFASTVLFSGPESRRTAVVKVNHPARFGRYTFYQAGYDLDNPQWTSLEVVRDPGVGLVFAGFLMLNLGLVLLFLPRLGRMPGGR